MQESIFDAREDDLAGLFLSNYSPGWALYVLKGAQVVPDLECKCSFLSPGQLLGSTFKMTIAKDVHLEILGLKKKHAQLNYINTSEQCFTSRVSSHSISLQAPCNL